MESANSEASGQIQKAIDFYQNDECEKAIEVLEAVNNQSPGIKAVVGLLGCYLYQAGHLEGALPILKQSVVLSPRSKLSSLHLFHTLWHMDLRDEALEEIKRHYEATGEMLSDYKAIIDGINQVL